MHERKGGRTQASSVNGVPAVHPWERTSASPGQPGRAARVEEGKVAFQRLLKEMLNQVGGRGLNGTFGPAELWASFGKVEHALVLSRA